MDELNSFPYLDAVVRETLRMHMVADGTSPRVATQADVIPLDKPFLGSDGILRNEIQYVNRIHIRAGIFRCRGTRLMCG
jgi:hypothetical protein